MNGRLQLPYDLMQKPPVPAFLLLCFVVAGPMKSRVLRVTATWFMMESCGRGSLIMQHGREQVVPSKGDRPSMKRDLAMIPQTAQSLPIYIPQEEPTA